ncbi:hypothetical protein [Xanthobacter flavus]|uniref:hypothetical protein n=1 Tax=Xanthobacter flavus TaxID=281 RepID=UPI003729AB20
MSKEIAIAGRKDISRFIVHLTRDDTNDFSNGANARRNLIKIIAKKTVYAYKPHCLFNKKLMTVDKTIAEKFKVACFTETPLDQIHLLTREIPGRNVVLSPYGIVFNRSFMVKSGAQPAIYINCYNNISHYRNSAFKLFDIFVQNQKSGLDDQDLTILPLINKIDEKYDFSWEREWRVVGSLKFKASDIVAVILPEKGENDIKSALEKGGIATISPTWTYEQIVSELSRQQRSTKSLSKVSDID